MVFLFLFAAFFGLGYYIYRYLLAAEWERLAYEQVAYELNEKTYVWEKKKQTIEQWMRFLVRAEPEQIHAQEIPGRLKFLKPEELSLVEKNKEMLFLQAQEQEAGREICASRFWETVGRGVRLCFSIQNWQESFFSQASAGMLLFGKEPLLVATPKGEGSYFPLLTNPNRLSQLVGQDLVTTWEDKGRVYFVGSRYLPKDQLTFVTFIPQSHLASRWTSLIVQTRALTLVILSLTALFIFLIVRWILNPLEVVTDQLKAIARGQFEIRFLKRPRNEIGMVMQVVEWMAQRIRELLDRTKETARLENEIKTVQVLQNNFYPSNRYLYGPFRIEGLIRPSQECGGDFWFCWRQMDRTYVLIADATGHGVSAALLTSSVFSLVHLFQEQGVTSLSLMSRYLNNTIYQISKGRWVVTGILLELDEHTGLMRWIHASHENLVYIPPDVKNWKEIEFIQEPSHPAWGESRDGAKAYISGEKLLQRGSRIILFTDGIWDWKPQSGDKKWNERTFYKALISADQELLLEFSQSNQITPDDVTFVMIAVDPAAEWVQGYDQLHLPLTEILFSSAAS